MSDQASSLLRDVVPFLAAVVPIIGTVLGYIGWKTRREKQLEIGLAFEKTLAGLSAPHPPQQLAAALLLRRFFDPSSELGTGGTPFADEALSVSVGVLRVARTGVLQKTLADGLAFAPTLRHADLQKCNLTNAHLGRRVIALSDGRVVNRTVDATGADFFRSDISFGSLRGATAEGAVFMEGRLVSCVFREALLRHANFREAILRNADFRKADLRDADFVGADLTGARFDGAKIAGARGLEGLVPGPAAQSDERMRIFVSRPACLPPPAAQNLDALCAAIEKGGCHLITLQREDYPSSGALMEVVRSIRTCHGLLLFEGQDILVKEGLWRPDTHDERQLSGRALSSHWLHVEGGIAAGLGLPLLVYGGGNQDEGLFSPDAFGAGIWFAPSREDTARAMALKEWLYAVRQRSGRA